MENAYGIGITNRYALFIDEEGNDPIDILKQTEVPDKKTKKVEVVKANVKVPPRKEAPRRDDNADKENQRVNQRFEGKRVLDARRAQEGPREERNNRINQEGGPRREVDDEGRGRGRGGRGGRGMGGRGRGDGAPRGRDGGGRGGKREFERKSGDARTGVKAEDKRGGGGKGNWGTMEDDIKETEDAAANTSLEEGTAPKEEDEEKREDEEDQGPKEEEPKELTLDEWKALQGRKDQPKFNLRKAGEGSDIDPKWKKAAAYKKEKEGQDDDEDEDEENYVYPQRANRQKHLLDIDFHFADQQAMRGGGRGRGRGRGGREGRGGGRGAPRGGREGEAPPRRGGARGGRGDSQQFRLDDQKAFPALG